MIVLKTVGEIERIRDAGKIASEVLMELKEAVRVGISTIELDHLAEALIKERGAVPAFKGYRGFPGNICVSINSEVVHGIPGSRKIRRGDLVSLDLGVLYRNYYADCAVSLCVDGATSVSRRLIDTCLSSLYKGIEKAWAGNTIGDISNAIQFEVEKNGFSVIRELVGHGIGKSLHEDPPVPNFGKKGAGVRLEKGMVIAIEPMISTGGFSITTLADGWTVVTCDHSLSAHFEHMVYIDEAGNEILTNWKV